MRMPSLAVGLIATVAGAGCAGELWGARRPTRRRRRLPKTPGFRATSARCCRRTARTATRVRRTCTRSRRARSGSPGAPTGLSIGEYAALQVATGKMPPPTAAAQPTDGGRAMPGRLGRGGDAAGCLRVADAPAALVAVVARPRLRGGATSSRSRSRAAPRAPGRAGAPELDAERLARAMEPHRRVVGGDAGVRGVAAQRNAAQIDAADDVRELGLQRVDEPGHAAAHRLQQGPSSAPAIAASPAYAAIARRSASRRRQ